ncbi:Class II aldolase/adducin N-terminal [Penicillium canescens]|nr:Class II aldolase/adducin N-terminal [Penicillium canescens]
MVVQQEEESAALAESLGEGKGIILRNYGLLTVGGTVDEAAYLFLLIEKSCKIQLAADAASSTSREKMYIDDEAARFIYENTSDPVSKPFSQLNKWLITFEQESLFAEFQGYLQWESAISHDGYKAL